MAEEKIMTLGRLRDATWALAATRGSSRRKAEQSETKEAYYLRRADEETSAAKRAADADLAEIHRELASRYLRLAELEQEPLASRE
jgi:hypothetical protein